MVCNVLHGYLVDEIAAYSVNPVTEAPSSPLSEQRERLRTKTFLRTKLDEVQGSKCLIAWIALSLIQTSLSCLCPTGKKSEGGVDFAYVDGIIGELNKHADNSMLLPRNLNKVAAS